MSQFKPALIFPFCILASLCTLGVMGMSGSRAVTTVQPTIAAPSSPPPPGRWQPKRNMGSIGSTLSGGRRGQAIANGL